MTVVTKCKQSIKALRTAGVAQVPGRTVRVDGAAERLPARIPSRGRVHLTSTRLGGRTFLRLCILSFRPHLADVEAALAETAAGIEAGA